MNRILVVLTLILSYSSVAQVVNTANMDTLESTVIGHLGIGGYVDTYYGYDFSEPDPSNIPYFVSSARLNELNINLAYMDVRYSSKKMRARFVPGFGTYMNANYASESGTLKNIVEGNIGILLSNKKKIWLDVGVLGSPFTNESAISKDHLMYTRSFAPEYVPYYITGAKLNFPIAKKLTATLFFLNGWQVIQDDNTGKSFATQLEFRPNDKMLFNWNTYVGDERSNNHPDFRIRYFSDLFLIFKPNKKWDATSCIYYGIQTIHEGTSKYWWQGNVIARYHFTERTSISSRIEYFNDPNQVMIISTTGLPSFSSYGSGLCFNLKITDNSMFRLEAREFFSNENSYVDKHNQPTNSKTWLIGNLTAWF